MSDPGTALQSAGPTVVDRTTGEILSVREASIEQLAEFLVNQQEFRAALTDAEETVAAETLERMDRAAQWTHRVGEYELKAPSPTAGTETYLPDVLRDVLARLVSTDKIDENAAGKALRRTLALELEVPWDEDPAAMADKLRQAIAIHVAGVEVTVLKAEPASRVSAAGVKALRKVPGVSEKLDEALAVAAAPKRRVKVTRSAS